MGSQSRCAVIVNPTKVSNDFPDRIRRRLTEAGYTDPLWLETTQDDPGAAMSEQAVRAGVELILSAGGDGTVRAVVSGLAGTGIPLGIVPLGTGNLLARNLDLPLDPAAALDVACGRHTRRIDTVVLRVDGGEPQRFSVMAGTGLDAAIMDETNDRLKSALGPAAYVVEAGRAAGRVPVRVRIRVDGGRVHRRRSMMCLIANVGQLTGGVNLIPRAHADDGDLDVYVASPHRLSHWFKVLLRLVTHQDRADDHVDVWAGQRTEITLTQPDTYQIDGDVEGEGERLVAEIDPGSLVVCVPEGVD